MLLIGSVIGTSYRSDLTCALRSQRLDCRGAEGWRGAMPTERRRYDDISNKTEEEMRQHVDRRALPGCRPNLKKPGPLLAEPRLHPRRPKQPL